MTFYSQPCLLCHGKSTALGKLTSPADDMQGWDVVFYGDSITEE